MRMLTVALALATLPSLALADGHHDKKARGHVATTDLLDDEPMPATAAAAPATKIDPSAPSGSRMDATIKAPTVSGAGSTGEAISRAPSTAAPAPRNEGAASGDALGELIARQMRKNAASIDACTAAAVHRRPSAAGTVELAVVVADRKVKSIHVSNDSVHDVDLDACLVKSGQSWKLQLASASFTWPVTISPSASR
jgi:hypothetical protein